MNLSVGGSPGKLSASVEFDSNSSSTDGSLHTASLGLKADISADSSQIDDSYQESSDMMDTTAESVTNNMKRMFNDSESSANDSSSAGNDFMNSAQNQANDAFNKTKDKVDEIIDNGKSNANEFKDNVNDAADEVKTKANDAADKAKTKANDAADKAKAKANELNDKANDDVNEIINIIENGKDKAKTKANELNEAAKKKADALADKAKGSKADISVHENTNGIEIKGKATTGKSVKEETKTKEQQPEESGDKKQNQQNGETKTKQEEDKTSDKPFRFFGINFAPLNTPIRRRLQTFAVLQWLWSITIFPVISVAFLSLFMLTPLMFIPWIYIGWIFLYDRHTPRRGGRRFNWVRNWSLWTYFRDYFPISLVKTSDLDPKHNYLIGYHPHGIIGCGFFCNFGTEATGFSQKFPGIKPYPLTLKTNFFWPIMRAYFMSAGFCDVTRESINWILNQNGKGNAAMLVIGGAQEALDARPNDYHITLKQRKGFVRLAIKSGAHLVPCYSFGENDLFKQARNPPGSWVRFLQETFKGFFGCSPPFFYGRGIFNYNFGLMPFRHPVVTVMGAPIPVDACPEPDNSLVDEVHQKYMDSLSDLFEAHKEKYGIHKDRKLQFV